MKKVLNVILKLLLIAYLAFSLSFSDGKERELLCNDLQITMEDTLKAGFLTKTDIEGMLLEEESEILGYPVRNINTRKLENKLKTSPYIKRAEIFYDLEGIMSVRVSQRRPVIRVITEKGNSYFLDEDGYLFRPAGKFTPHILVSNGNFTDGPSLRGAKNISELMDKEEYSEWIDLHRISLFIDNDDFWRSQCVQLYLNSDGEFELIPRVGAHQIVLGTPDRIDEKFNKLMILYREGLDYEGWNKYEKINLKYTNQVICTKR